ncbi:erythromycin esterase family protein [Actinoplanes sp. NBRC 101535]|uniref:erythromycin esterase family protein n=1 Tax=Actinoplanes sp. NBRC 101535 TaxID=3032196 RepID=UPI0024A49578|nr:erythromycin esterase family protein [Actinoplanes sp. NBRC 101535]GLY06992.1 erythromycin esterase [Actinoplanes sp. NBRC 101535]
MDFARYAADNAVPLATLDPHAPFDDLEPFADPLAGARVVAIGENSHLVSEFYRLRHRLQRFLTERLGFGVYALESGFTEGLAVDAWVRGERPVEEAINETGITYNMGKNREFREHLESLRTATPPTRFFGLDVPGSTTSPLSALESIHRYLQKADPDAIVTVERLITAISVFAGEHALPAYAAYGALTPDDRNRITADYAELATRFDALESDYREATGDDAYATTRHELRLALLLDQAMRQYIAATEGVHPKLAPRDRGMAETVFWLLDQLGPDTKIIVAAHNSHIQRTPLQTPAFALSAAGRHLSTRLHDGYVAIAVTCTSGTTVAHRPDADAPGGVAITGAELAAPEPGSVEEPLAGRLCALDLRPARTAGLTGAPDRIRVLDRYQPTPVVDAYDLVVNIPSIHPTAQVTNS